MTLNDFAKKKKEEFCDLCFAEVSDCKQLEQFIVDTIKETAETRFEKEEIECEHEWVFTSDRGGYGYDCCRKCGILKE
jgi:hypothetical protein